MGKKYYKVCYTAQKWLKQARSLVCIVFVQVCARLHCLYILHCMPIVKFFPCCVFPWFYCVAGVFTVQQVLLAAVLCSEGGRVSWPIYEGKNLSHMAPVL